MTFVLSSSVLPPRGPDRSAAGRRCCGFNSRTTACALALLGRCTAAFRRGRSHRDGLWIDEFAPIMPHLLLECTANINRIGRPSAALFDRVSTQFWLFSRSIFCHSEQCKSAKPRLEDAVRAVKAG